MVEYLNYLQEKDKMIREFKFFHGITIQSEGIQGIIRTLRAQWRPELADDLNDVYTIDATEELTRLMSRQIAEEVDRDIVRRLTGIWNGGIREIANGENVNRNVIPMTIRDPIHPIDFNNTEINNNLSDEINYMNYEENDEVIDEIIRRINGGNRAWDVKNIWKSVIWWGFI